MNDAENNLYSNFKEAIRKSRIISFPKNNISTFGNTVYNYYFVGRIAENKTQVREGHIKIRRPLFVTPYSDKEIFKGFSENDTNMAKKFLEDIQENDAFLMEYQFEHLPRHHWVEKIPHPILLGEMKSNYENNLFDVIVTGHPESWPMALIKFCLKIIEKSFPINISELEERGFFDENRIPPQTKKKVDSLFSSAEKNSKYIQTLGNFLVTHKIFDIYEERFFNLMDKVKKNA